MFHSYLKLPVWFLFGLILLRYALCGEYNTVYCSEEWFIWEGMGRRCSLKHLGISSGNIYI